MRPFAIYGRGHLASTLRAELEHHGALNSAPSFADPAFVAHDVIDHEDPQLDEVHACLSAVCAKHPMVVLLSQVPPGWTRKAIAAVGGKAIVFYQVDTIIVCRALERMLRPEQIVVGCAAPERPLPLAYQTYLALHKCPVLQMSYESAEMAKCAINYMLAKQIEAANELLSACLEVGADYGDVERVLRNDARIGPHAYLRPGKTNQHLDRDVQTIRQMLPSQVMD